MPMPDLPPSCCAGLRQTLLQGWQQDFPLHPSPFRQMAARSGATPRELLSLCASLQRSGALQPIRGRWGAALRRERWRLAFASDAAGLGAALAALPGCFRLEHSEGMPALWAEFETLDEAALQRQLAHLPQQPLALLRLPASDAALPCDDPQLAACIERGLPLCSRPFAACGRPLGCSEQRVLTHLNAWRRSGQLEGLTLKPPPTPVPRPGLLALWRQVELAAELPARLLALPGMDCVVPGPGSPAWPWRLSVVMCTAPLRDAAPWRERLAEAGLTTPPDACLPLRIEQPRDQALLFDTGDAQFEG